MPRLAPEARNAGTRINDPHMRLRRWTCHLCDTTGLEASIESAVRRLEAHHDLEHRERP